MTKTELIETFTAEQLAEMVVKMENVSKARITKCEVSEDKELLKGKCDKCGEEFILSLDNKHILCTKAEFYATQEANKQLNKDISELQSEVEKYRKAFEDTKKECDCQVAEYQKKFEDLEYDLKTAGEKIQDLADENMKLQVEKNYYKSKLEFLEVDRMRVKKNEITVFLPTKPIKVADILINADGECEHNLLMKSIFGKDKGTYRIFGVPELRQIAEHLLVYCNHNVEAEE